MIPQALSRDAQYADILRRVRDLEASPDLYGASITFDVIRTGGDNEARLEMDGADLTLIAYDDSLEEQARFGKLADGTYGITGRIDGAEVTGSSLSTDPDEYGRTVNVSTVGVTITDPTEVRPGLASIELVQSEYLTLKTSLTQSDFPLSRTYQSLRLAGASLHTTDDDDATHSEIGTSTSGVYLRSTHDGYLQLNLTDALYLVGASTVSGQTANVYMDPTTGKISRIA